jgi:6-phosphogluconolactonase
MEPGRVIVCKDSSEIAEYLAGFIAGKTSSLPRGTFLNIALSGGNTPEMIFKEISLRFGNQIDLDRIRFFQVDERCVPPDHPESNFRMIKESLLDGLNIPPDQVFRISGENDPAPEADRYGKILSENLPTDGKWPVFDLILLGLGNDGHTASLFPGDETALQSRQLCEVTNHPQSGRQRITLTLRVINHALDQIFLVTGLEKADIVARVLEGTPEKKYPASLVKAGNGRQIWLLDTEAAELLS